MKPRLLAFPIALSLIINGIWAYLTTRVMPLGFDQPGPLLTLWSIVALIAIFAILIYACILVVSIFATFVSNDTVRGRKLFAQSVAYLSIAIMMIIMITAIANP